MPNRRMLTLELATVIHTHHHARVWRKTALIRSG